MTPIPRMAAAQKTVPVKRKRFITYLHGLFEVVKLNVVTEEGLRRVPAEPDRQCCLRPSLVTPIFYNSGFTCASSSNKATPDGAASANDERRFKLKGQAITKSESGTSIDSGRTDSCRESRGGCSNRPMFRSHKGRRVIPACNRGLHSRTRAAGHSRRNDRLRRWTAGTV